MFLAKITLHLIKQLPIIPMSLQTPHAMDVSRLELPQSLQDFVHWLLPLESRPTAGINAYLQFDDIRGEQPMQQYLALNPIRLLSDTDMSDVSSPNSLQSLFALQVSRRICMCDWGT